VLESAPRPGAEVAGVRDPVWLLARELDVLPRPLAPIEPQYPPAARARGISGHAQLEVSIDDTGRVVAAHAVSGQPPGVFDQAAEAAFRAARFAPGLKDGRPVHARLTIRVVFELDEAAAQPR
jgi:protein TonB